MESKEQLILEIFFNQPTREWHFEEILKETGMARSKADRWLKKLLKENIIKRLKERSKMPYYLSDYDSPSYRYKKKQFALEKLYQSGLLNHLVSLSKARTIIIFGSFSRSDWYTQSDIDLFIYGDPEGLKISEYETRLHREIQLFVCREKKDLEKLGEGLIKNIIKGNLIKGDLDFVKVKINA